MNEFIKDEIQEIEDNDGNLCRIHVAEDGISLTDYKGDDVFISKETMDELCGKWSRYRARQYENESGGGVW